MYDAKFHVFLQLGKFLDNFLPKDYQLTLVQHNAIHEYADKIAKDLTSGDYEYTLNKV